MPLLGGDLLDISASMLAGLQRQSGSAPQGQGKAATGNDIPNPGTVG